ncbi:BMP family ABC transporter substrate-binding protein [Bacillus sp. FSL W8-0223]|uniref:BMP family lipoprotein n=1 Tax=Bacillus sp. FSL W8-0223 TaxID=2954595 RepID=UPI0030F5CFAD
MKKQSLLFFVLIFFLTTVISGCGVKEEDPLKHKTKIGIMLSDDGLGDQSFSDAAFRGLMKARDDLGIVFDYRELKDTKTYEQGLKELVKEKNDIVIGLGYMVQEDLEKVAKQYPNQKFVLIDAVSDLPNVTSITFKEDEGSYLAGVIAALTTKTKTVGFIGGDNVPLIQKFARGFEEGVKSVDPSIKILTKYAGGNFGDDKLGARMAKEMIANHSDVLYAAAGFTGVGVLKEAERNHVYAIGVDSDQYFYAEKAVVTSMMKNVDVAIFNIIKDYKKNKELPSHPIELGLKENGVGLAPIRVIPFTDKDKKALESAKEKLINGEITLHQN